MFEFRLFEGKSYSHSFVSEKFINKPNIELEFEILKFNDKIKINYKQISGNNYFFFKLKKKYYL
jgi:hypothetical protein